MRAIDRHLYSRNGRLYYRHSLSKYLKEFLPFNEIVLSLGTSDLAQGRLYVAKLDLEVEQFINRIVEIVSQSQDEKSLQSVNSLVTGCFDKFRQSVGLHNIRHSPHWYSSLQGQLKDKKFSSNVKLFSKVTEEYLKECIGNSPKTINHKRITFDIFISIIGDLSIDQISREHARHYKNKMIDTPSNLLKILDLKSYKEVDWEHLPSGEKQSLLTVNSRLTPLINFFDWAERNDLFDNKNPFKGMIIKEAQYRSKRREIYTDKQLNTLFSCPIYSGSSGKNMPQSDLPRIVVPVPELVTGLVSMR